MKQTLHLLFCRLAATAAASWAVMLLVWPELSRWLPAGELPALHARCVGVLHLALAAGLLCASLLHHQLFVAAHAATWLWFGALTVVAVWAAARLRPLRAV